jgi:hypothetical protein
MIMFNCLISIKIDFSQHNSINNTEKLLMITKDCVAGVIVFHIFFYCRQFIILIFDFYWLFNDIIVFHIFLYCKKCIILLFYYLLLQSCNYTFKINIKHFVNQCVFGHNWDTYIWDKIRLSGFGPYRCNDLL